MATAQDKVNKIRKGKIFMDSILFGAILLLLFGFIAFVQAGFNFDAFKEVWFWILNLTAIGSSLYFKNSMTTNSSVFEEQKSSKFNANSDATKHAKSAISKAALTRELKEHSDTLNDIERIKRLMDFIDTKVDSGQNLSLDFCLNQMGGFRKLFYRPKAKKLALTADEQETLMSHKTVLNRIVLKKERDIELLEEETQLLVDYSKTLNGIAIDEITPSMLFTGLVVDSKQSKYSFNRAKAVADQNRTGMILNIIVFFVLNSLAFTGQEVSFATILPVLIKILSIGWGGVMGLLAGKKVFDYALATSENRLGVLAAFLDKYKDRVAQAMNGPLLVVPPKEAIKEITK